MATKRRKKNPAAVSLGRLGGQAKSPAKTKAARRNARRRWALYAEKMATIKRKAK